MSADLPHLLGSIISGQFPLEHVPEQRWTELVELALDQSVGPMLAHSLTEAGYAIDTQPYGMRLSETARRAALSHIVLEQAQQEVDFALRAADISSIWLKGIALARTVYPQPGLRPMGDLDVLVPYQQRERALAVAQSIGYDFYTLGGVRSTGDALTLQLSHHYHLKRSGRFSELLEIHFRLLSQDEDLLSLADLEWFWTQRQSIQTESGFEFDTLRPEAHLLYLCAHVMLQHGEQQVPLLSFLDMHQLMTHMALNWEVVIDQAVTLGWTFAVERALRHCTEFFGTAIPAEVFSDLVQRRPAFEDTSRLGRLQGAGNRWERVRREMNLLPRKEQLRLAFRLVFPAPSYIRARYSVKSGWLVLPYYLYRWLDQGGDVAWSLWKRLTRSYTDGAGK